MKQPKSAKRQKQTKADKYREQLRQVLTKGSFSQLIDEAAGDSVICGLIMDKRHEDSRRKFDKSYAALLNLAGALPEETAKTIQDHVIDMDESCIELYSHAAENMFDLVVDFFLRKNAAFRALIGGAE